MPRSAKRLPPNSLPPSGRPHVAVAGAVALIAAAVALQPIREEGLWWEVSRGGAVLVGTASPSRTLLAGDPASEADWLGGVPWHLLHSFAGPSGLMLARCLGAAGTAALAWRLAAGGSETGVALPLTAAVLLASGPALDPGPRWWDLAGAWAVVSLTRRDGSGRLSGPAVTFVLAVLWANLGPRSVLLLVATLASGATLVREPGGGRLVVRRTAAVLAGLCLTPRGPLGLWDSLRVLCPWLVLSPAEAAAAGAPWRPVWSAPDAAVLSAWALLSAASLAAAFEAGRPRPGRLMAWAASQTLAFWNASNLPVLAPWALVAAVVPGSATAAAAAPRPGGPGGPAWAAYAAAVSLLAAATAGGLWPGAGRLGWGVASGLEPRQVAAVLGPASGEGTIFTPDLRSAGIAAWAAPPGFRPWLTPQRALLAGVWRDERRLAEELRTGWQQRHRRADGGWGGWWVTLASRRTRLLLLPAEETRMIAALEPELWKPMLLDAPVLPYALAGDEPFGPAVIEVLSQREFVESGAWTPSAPDAAGTDWTVDLWGRFTGRVDPAPVRRQVRVFRAMGLPFAAARLLHAAERAGVGPLGTDVAGVQIDLAERERLLLGRPTAFRAALLAAVGARPHEASALAIALAAPRTAPGGEAGRLVRRYLEEGPAAAAAEPPDGTPASWFVRSTLWSEAGDPAAALRSLEELRRSTDDPFWTNLADGRLRPPP